MTITTGHSDAAVGELRDRDKQKVTAALASLPDKLKADIRAGIRYWVFGLPPGWVQASPFQLFHPMTWLGWAFEQTDDGRKLVELLQKLGLEVKIYAYAYSQDYMLVWMKGQPELRLDEVDDPDNDEAKRYNPEVGLPALHPVRTDRPSISFYWLSFSVSLVSMLAGWIFGRTLSPRSVPHPFYALPMVLLCIVGLAFCCAFMVKSFKGYQRYGFLWGAVGIFQTVCIGVLIGWGFPV